VNAFSEYFVESFWRVIPLRSEYAFSTTQAMILVGLEKSRTAKNGASRYAWCNVAQNDWYIKTLDLMPRSQ
jgi:hypothetical protein